MPHRIPPALLLCLALAPAPARAASFDCAKAASKIEKAICATPRLSAQDDRLAAAYRALQRASGNDEVLKRAQRNWLGDTRAACENAPDIVTCLGKAYATRVTMLVSLAAFAIEPDNKGAHFDIRDASKTRDFTVRMMRRCDPPDADGGSCEGPGIVDVTARGGTLPTQKLAMENIFVSFTKQAKPLINSTDLYEYQGVINVGDFNFDGREDFAVQNGNNGSYGGPSYDVYLGAADGAFAYSAPLSDLIQQSLGFFRIDAKAGTLTTESKDGCCHHETTVYAVTADKPVPVSRVVDDADSETTGTRTEERMVNGNWRTVKTAQYRE